MQNPYLNIHRIEFMVTYRCTGRCKHCSVGDRVAHPGPHAHVQPDAAVETVRWLAQHFPVSSVMTFGGEPLLYPDIVCAIHQEATNQDIQTRQLITNGFFSRDAQIIRSVAAQLQAAGVNNLLLSVDAFHQEIIPLEIVQHFAQSLLDTGISGLRMSPAWLVNSAHENSYNAQTRALLAVFEAMGIPVGHGNDIFLSGNAAKYLKDYYPAIQPDLSLPCGSMPYTEPLNQVSTLSIEPNGDVVVCSFVIGNIYREPIADIVARYDPYAHEAMRAVTTGGVSALIALAREKELSVSWDDCCSACDVCHRLARALQK